MIEQYMLLELGMSRGKSSDRSCKIREGWGGVKIGKEVVCFVYREPRPNRDEDAIRRLARSAPLLWSTESLLRQHPKISSGRPSPVLAERVYSLKLTWNHWNDIVLACKPRNSVWRSPPAFAIHHTCISS